MKNYVRAVAVIAVLAIVTAACGTNNDTSGDASGGQEPTTGGTFQVGMLSDVINAFDPQKEYYSVSWAFLRCCLTRTLLSYSGTPAAEGGNDLQPDLAAAQPTISEDGLTWTFKLKDDIKFGPPFGTEITADDVIRGVERIADPEGSAGGYSFYYDVIEGFSDMYAGKANSISGLKAVDDKTLEITLNEPAGDLGFRFAMPATTPIPEGADVGHEKDYGQFLVATGPYMFEGSEDLDFSVDPKQQQPVSGNDPGRSYVLVRNPDYVASSDDLRPAYVDRIEIAIGGAAQDIQNKVDANELDICFDCVGAPTSALKRYQTDPNLKDQLHVYDADAIAYSAMNLGVKPFDDVHIRKAFNWVFDKNSMRLLGGGPIQGDIAGHNIPNPLIDDLLVDYDPFATTDDAGDVNKAMEEVKLSKYDSDGDGVCDAPECKDILTVADSSDPSPKVVAVMEDNLAPLGITLDVKFLDLSAMYPKCYDINAKIGFCPTVSWGKDYADAYTWTPLYESTGIGCCNYQNLGASPEQVKDAGLDAQPPSTDADIDACQALAGDVRVQCWADWDKTLTEEIVSTIPRRFANNIDIVSERVVNYTFDQFSGQMSVDHVALADASS